MLVFSASRHSHFSIYGAKLNNGKAFVRKKISQCNALHIVGFDTLLLKVQMKIGVNIFTYFMDDFSCAVGLVLKKIH